jgi:hypothetical protein
MGQGLAKLEVALALAGARHGFTSPVSQVGKGVALDIKSTATTIIDKSKSLLSKKSSPPANITPSGPKPSPSPDTGIRRNSAGQAIGKDGRYIMDPTRVDRPTVSRPYVRQGVRNEVIARAPRDSQGRLLDPNTFEVIDGRYHLGHKPGLEWWRIRDRATSEGWTRQQLSDYVNNPDMYQIELPSNNLSHRFEAPK